MSQKQLQPITRETDLSEIVIGNSNFTDDIWDLSPLITKQSLKDSFKKIKFDFIKTKDMKHTVKLYAYHKLGQLNKPEGLKKIINGSFPSFIEYCNHQKINSFSEITRKIFLNYAKWLKEKRQVAPDTGYQNCFVIEDIVKTGQIKGWNVPQKNIFADISSSNLWQRYKYKNERKHKPIPNEIFDQILNCALKEKKINTLTKAGIIIQSQTGLRISEVVSIKEGCLHTDSNGNTFIEVILGKTESEPVIHKVFVNNLVRDVISELNEYTKNYRKESGRKELFLRRFNGNIKVVNINKWSERLNKFIKRWDIRDDQGNLYKLNSHQFRATFVRELIKKNIPLEIIFDHFGHVSIEMTAHYLQLEEEEIKKHYAEMILSPHSKIAGKKGEEIKDKLEELFNGKTAEEIDYKIEKISKSMSFNPLPHGVCLYDFRRGNCTDGDGCFFFNCPNYITEERFYPILKKQLKLLEREMERFKELGRERDYQRRYVKWQYLELLVRDLEVQIDGQAESN